MHPELIHLPGGFTIKTYGFFLMLGFLSAVWMAMKRAEKVKANSDRILDLAFFVLIFGILGARVFYVAHYWKSQFAKASLFDIINVTSGGLEFLGGFLGAFAALLVYCWWTKVSLRLYMDIAAPSAMWGVAFGRVGCFFNGCCFGGLLTTGAAGAGAAAPPPWAVQFPYGSPAQYRHWEDRLISVPGELIFASKEASQPQLVPEAMLSKSVEELQGPQVAYQEAGEALEQAEKNGAAGAEIERLKKNKEAAKQALEKHVKENAQLMLYAKAFPSRKNPERGMTVTELQDLAHQVHSQPVHPAQLYAAGQALLLSLLLSAIFYYRRRHGIVAAWMLMLYPVQRVLEEIIRADNPHDVAGLTISQSISLALFLCGLVMLIVLYRMPERSPSLDDPDSPSVAPAAVPA